MAFTDNSVGGRVIRQGIMPYRLQLGDTCNVGDAIGYDETSEAWERADANGKIIAEFIAGEPCATSDDYITVFRQVIMSGFTGSSEGDPVYVGDTKGEYLAYPETWVHQQVGTCISDTEALFTPNSMAGTHYAVHGRGWGLYVRSELNDTVATQAGQIWGGARIDMKAVTGSTISVDAYGLYVFAQLQSTPTSSSALLRLEDGCSASCGVDTYIMFISAGTADDPDSLLLFGPTLEPSNGAWSLTTSAGGTNTGRIKVNVGGYTRYIPLTTT